MTSTQEQAQEAAAQAKDKAGEAAQQARGRVRDQVDQRSTEAGERVSAQASDVRSVAGALRDQGQDKPAELADKAADQAERLGGYLKDADADRILGDLEDLGRRQPMAVVFGGLALGFVASRFLKASSQQRYATSSSTRNGGSDLTAAQPALPRTTPAPPVTAPPADTFGTGGIATGGPAGAPFPDPVVETDPRVPAPRTAGALMSEQLGRDVSRTSGGDGHGDLRDEPIGELLKRLSSETTTLVKMELDLAKAEMTQKGKEAGLGAGFLSGGAVAGLLALGSLTAFLILLLDGALANWLAALIVTLLWAAVAGVLALQGRNKLQDATPRP